MKESEDRPRFGRPRLSSAIDDDRELVRISHRNRRLTNTQLKRERNETPRLSSAIDDDRELVRISHRNRRLTNTQLKRERNETSLVSCSSRIVRRRLDGRVARKKPLLTEQSD